MLWVVESEKAKGQIRHIFQRLSDVWSLNQKSEVLRGTCTNLDYMLAQLAQERNPTINLCKLVGMLHVQNAL